MWNSYIDMPDPSQATDDLAIESKTMWLEAAIRHMVENIEQVNVARMYCVETLQSITIYAWPSNRHALLCPGPHLDGYFDMMYQLGHIAEADTVLAIGERNEKDPDEAGRAILRKPTLREILARMRHIERKHERLSGHPVRRLRTDLIRRGWTVEIQPPGYMPTDLPTNRTPDKEAVDTWMFCHMFVAQTRAKRQVAEA